MIKFYNEKKEIKLINKAYDALYDVDSKLNLFREQKEFIKDFMEKEGYELVIKLNKCLFRKVRNE